MKLLIITNYNHIASKKLIKYLKLKRVSFDLIDSNIKKKINVLKKYDYLISFLNSKHISRKIIKKVKKGSFNFHPGPPEYPGFGCYNFALLDKVNFYGSTVHKINNKFDDGEIVNVVKFKTSYKRLNLDKLISMTHKSILKQAKDFINTIIKGRLSKNHNIRWKRKAYSKKEFEIAREIKLKDSRANIKKKIKAFTYRNFDSVYINFKGFKFEFKKK